MGSSCTKSSQCIDLRVDLLARLQEFLRGGLQVIAVLGIAARRGLDRGRHIGPEAGGIEKPLVVRRLEEVVEHEVAEAEAAEGPHDFSGASASGIGSPLSIKAVRRFVTVSARSAVASKTVAGAWQDAIAPVVRLEEVRPARRAVNEAGQRACRDRRRPTPAAAVLLQRVRRGARARRSH